MDIKKLKGIVVSGAVGVVIGASAAYAAGVRWPGHKHLQRAENQLVNAKQALNAATHDCGGHRVAAIGHIDAAMAEVKEARNWANAHPEAFK